MLSRTDASTHECMCIAHSPSTLHTNVHASRNPCLLIDQCLYMCMVVRAIMSAANSINVIRSMLHHLSQRAHLWHTLCCIKGTRCHSLLLLGTHTSNTRATVHDQNHMPLCVNVGHCWRPPSKSHIIVTKEQNKNFSR